LDKKTILAVVLSTLVIIAFYMGQALLFPPKQQAVPQGVPVTQVAPVTAVPETTGGQPVVTPSGGQPVSEAPIVAEEEIPARTVTVETDLFVAQLTNEGGDITSFRLKNHRDGDEDADMIFSGDPGQHAFGIAFGAWNSAPLASRFNVRRENDYTVEFSREFAIAGTDKTFTLAKKYTFVKNEYMFQLDVTIDGRGEIPPLGAGAAYTLGFGPQMGPRFEKLDEQHNYRHYFTFVNGKLKQEKVGASSPVEISSRFAWTALMGKYFAFIAVPDATPYTAVFSMKPDAEGVPQASRLYLSRPALQASRATDIYRFYLGPKTQDALGVYDNAKNVYKYTDLQISKLGATSGFLSILNPLEWLLKQMLTFFNAVFHNYGVAIILVTLIVKLILFPLTKKSTEAGLRMQAIAPKIKELQEKYKDNPQKLNLEMAAFYKKEGYNPLSGCLPMLLQLPIFFAMYNLFNNHFDLRGAMFIPGWIPDLSLPESIWNFAPFRLPILGWSDIRLLPFIYVGSQLLYGKVTQTPDTASNANMKMMLYVMPIVFFFVLYNVPSGLLVYWIMSNLLTLVQQYALNKYIKQKKAAMGMAIEAQPKPVIAPHKNKKKRK
jgi:YidC/Oxa1 family membrane protein insertase